MMRAIACGVVVVLGCGPATKPAPEATGSPKPVAAKPQPTCELPRSAQAATTTAERAQAVATLRTLAKRCPKQVARFSGELAKVWHNSAMKNLAPGPKRKTRYVRNKVVRKGTLRPADLEPLDRMYKLHLALTPPGKKHAQAAYYRAELLWTMADGETDQRQQTARWDRAAAAFGRAATDPHLRRTLLKDVARAEVLSYKNALASASQVIRTRRKPVVKSVPEREQRMIDAFERYARIINNPKDPEVVTMQFLAARIYWRHELWDRAVPLLETIVADHLTSNVGEYAVNILLDTLNRTKRVADMARWVVEVRKKKTWLATRPDLKHRLDLLYQQLQRNGVVP